MFHVGQKVVCVDDSPGPSGEDPLVNKGCIYTISEVYEGGIGVHLAEVRIPRDSPYLFRRGWKGLRFRPVVEKKTDISVFTEILRRETVDDLATVYRKQLQNQKR